MIRADRKELNKNDSLHVEIFTNKFQYKTKRGKRENIITGPDPGVLYQRIDQKLPTCIHCHTQHQETNKVPL